MDNVKDDEYYKEKIISDIDHIVKHMENIDELALIDDEILFDALSFRLVQIAENAKHLSDKFKESHSDIEWPQINGLRNVLIHDYDNVNYSVVYETLKDDIIKLKSQLEKE